MRQQCTVCCTHLDVEILVPERHLLFSEYGVRECRVEGLDNGDLFASQITDVFGAAD